MFCAKTGDDYDQHWSAAINTSTGARFWAKVTKTGTCWVWSAARDRYGYGKFGLNGAIVLTHRLAYESIVGPIPEGLELDHLCRVRACCNPAHLEPVTHQENARRGDAGGVNHRNRVKTHCLKGHAFDAANTYVTPTGARKCRTCKAATLRQLRLRRKASMQASAAATA